MLLNSYNEVKISISLVSQSPVIIKEARYGQTQKESFAKKYGLTMQVMPDVIPISRGASADIEKATTKGTVADLPFYLPGSSLRGAWRSHLERILRGLDGPEQARVCDPLEDGEDESYRSCSGVLEQRSNESFIPYSASCPVCRLFGNTAQASRISISDGIPQSKPVLEQREHVRIDRKSGKVKDKSPVLTFLGLHPARFSVDLTLRNFELPHLKLLSLLLGDLRQGNVPIGFGKSKGYGVVKAEIESLRFSFAGLDHPEGALRGVAEHPEVQTAQWFQHRYGLTAQEPLEVAGAEWIRSEFRLDAVLDIKAFQEAAKKISLPWRSMPLLSERATAGRVAP